MPTKKPTPAPASAANFADDGKATNQDNAFKLIIKRGEAGKLSPKSSGKVYFQLARHTDENKNYLRIDGNDGGGLHSREWIALDQLIAQLKSQAGHPFKSLVLKACMKGKSANNASFLAAILRSPEIKLIQPAENSMFLHQLVDDFDSRSEALLKRTS